MSFDSAEIEQKWRTQRKGLIRDTKKKHKYASKRVRLVQTGD